MRWKACALRDKTRFMTGEAEEIFVLDRRVRLLQPVGGGFRTSLDSVMLAAACPAQAGDHVADLGAGVGGAGFCLLARVAGATLCGVELQAEYHALAERNIALNNMQGRAQFFHGDIRDFKPARPFDHVICNPPYLDTGTYTKSPEPGRAAALGHDDRAIDVEDWVRAAHRVLKSKGSLTMIHRADYTDKIIHALGRRFGAVEIIPLWPRMGQAAKRVIIRARKDRKSPCILHPGLVLHEVDGGYTREADGILRGIEGVLL